jgi:NADPH:quinone reductase-like Zn-dependent oxidoreductase
LKKGGVYVAIGGVRQGMEGLFIGPFASIGSGKKFTFGTYFLEKNNQPLQYFKQIIEEGKIKPFVEKTCFPQELPEVITDFVKNHAQGKVVVKMDF